MRVTIEPLDIERDLALVHAWVTHPRSVFWQMPDASLADVAAEYRMIAEDPHHHAWLGRVDGVPAFLAETYDPACLAKWKVIGIASDVDRARALYERAMNGGVAEAATRVAALGR